MMRFWQRLRAESVIAGPVPWILLLLALALMGLTHGVLEQASRWQPHFVENLEAFFPLALALSTAPLLTLDVDQNMVEVTARVPSRPVLHLRWLAIWGPFLIFAGLVLTVMTFFFGSVPWPQGVLAGLAPSAFLAGLATWGASLSGRTAAGYLLAIGILVADLILKVMGAFASFPSLQWIDCFAFRWPISGAPSWQTVSLLQLVVGLGLIEAAILCAPRLYRRLL
ncbi:MAG: hypothetical protein M1415_06865 [Firmicutes bacterium]|nr:hypothetical protein [Bacillota bacterium]MCL5063880.1 hypothetical protein [Bacillota bacterium]